MRKEFTALKIVEIASVLAGPSVGLFFAELGARVIKVENKKTGGDVTRSWRLPTESKGQPISAYYAAVNWNKESIFMDFTDAADFAELMEAIKTADVLIANFKKGDAEKFKLDYPTLKKINPNLIYGEITGFGSDSDRVAYDLILQAESGFMSMNGTPNSGPVKMPVALIDLLAGHQLKEGLLAALYKQAIGQIQSEKVSVSLYDSALASLANQATNWLMEGHIPERIGSKHPNIAPYGELFTTADNFTITLAIGSDKQFTQLCKVLGDESLSKNEVYNTNFKRVSNRERLALNLQESIGHFNADELIQKLHTAYVPVAQIKNLKDVFTSPEAQQLILHEEVNGYLTKRVKTAIFKTEQ